MIDEPINFDLDVLTIESAAEQLGIGKTTIYKEVREGKIPALRMGRRFLIPRRALAAMLAGADWKADFPELTKVRLRPHRKKQGAVGSE